MDSIPLPLSQSSLDAFGGFSLSFMLPLTADERRTVLQAFLHLNIASKGTKTPRLLQLRVALAVIASKDLIVRSATGPGKTLAMILPVLSLPKTSAVIPVSPLRLIQDNHAGVAEFAKDGITSIAINCFTPEDEDLWQVNIFIRSINFYSL
ncbi:hypothetical protein K438DRAFT_2065058 [Mycena galopus ATCC 62051]|nr:hypothetical protein K438DRAFT_2065058 [Mycena galopus ATCC 62051]